MGAEAVFERFRGHEQDADAQDRLWQELARTVLADRAVPFEEHWRLYQAVFAERRSEDGPPQAWRPDPGARDDANLSWLMDHAGAADYGALHRWSVQHRPAYWQAVIERLGIPFHTPPKQLLVPKSPVEDPEWLSGARLNIADACFQAPAGKVAIIASREGSDQITMLTYGELRVLVDRVSVGLRAAGIKAGDAVALYLPMTAECVAAYLGIVQAGCVVVSIPDSFAPKEVATRLRLGKARAVITVEAFTRAGKRVPMHTKAVEAGAERCIVIASERPDDLREADLWWDDFLGAADAGPFASVPCEAQDTTNILFSSGTTGEPKAIGWTHLTPIKAAADGHFHQDIHLDDVVAWPTNIGWMMGPWLIYASFANQATMALYEGAPTGDGFLSFLDRAGVTVMGVVPAVVRSWLAAGVGPHRLPKVRVWSSTGEASNPHDYLYLMSLAGYRAPVIEYCGGTEIGGGHLTGTVLQPASPATFTTPALGLDFVILSEGDAPIRPGEHGELYLIPPSIGLSQHLLNKDHHATYYADCPPGPDGAVLRRHGDEVQWLGGSWWRAQGRADDTMNLGGIKVGSVELETVMDGHPDVRESAAIAVSPEDGGAERLVVFVVAARVGVEATTLAGELQTRVKAELNPLFRIHDVVLVEALPRTASNKVMRRQLRAQYSSDTN